MAVRVRKCLLDNGIVHTDDMKSGVFRTSAQVPFQVRVPAAVLVAEKGSVQAEVQDSVRAWARGSAPVWVSDRVHAWVQGWEADSVTGWEADWVSDYGL